MKIDIVLFQADIQIYLLIHSLTYFLTSLKGKESSTKIYVFLVLTILCFDV